jgi:hypothetical protein
MTQSLHSESHPSSTSSATPWTTQDLRKRQLMQRIRDVKSELYALERELSCVQIGVAAPYRYDAQEVPAWLRSDHGNRDSSDDRKGR